MSCLDRAARLTPLSNWQRVIPAARARVLNDFDHHTLVGRLAEIYRAAMADG